MNKIVVLYIDDWACLYINGVEENQGHDIDVDDLKNYCPIESIDTRYVDEKLEEWVLDSGSFPETLEECLAIENE